MLAGFGGARLQCLGLLCEVSVIRMNSGETRVDGSGDALVKIRE